MLIEDDWYGKFGTCIACGFVHDSERCDPKDIEEEERLMAGKQRRRQPSHGKLRLYVLRTSPRGIPARSPGMGSMAIAVPAVVRGAHPSTEACGSPRSRRCSLPSRSLAA
jgi:hypothetical protein